MSQEKRMRREEEEMERGGNGQSESARSSPPRGVNEEGQGGAAQPGMEAVQEGDAELEMAPPPPPPQPSNPLDIPEVLEIILGNLEGKDLNSALNTCQSWYNLVDTRVGYAIDPSSELVVEEGGGRTAGRFKGLEGVSQIGTRELHVRGGHWLVRSFNPIYAPKWPEMLWKLEVKSAVHPELFRRLTKDSIQLKELSLHLGVIRWLPDADLVGLKFKGLRSLTFTSTPYLESQYREEVAALPKLRAFLDGNTWRTLKDFHCNFPTMYPEEQETTAAVVRFLARHPALVEVELGRMEGSVDLGIFSQFSGLKTLTVKETPDFVNGDQLPHSLTKLCLEGRILTTDVLHFLNQLPELKELQLRMESAPASLQGPDPYQLDEDAIMEFVLQPLKRVKIVHLTGSLMDTWSEYFFFHNGDPINGKIIPSVPGDIKLFLNERGHYEPVPLPPL